MKRSTINRAMQWADTYLRANNIHLPEYAYWPLETWKDNASRLETIRKVMLGWDVTDFGMDDFDHIGAVLYTVRNGSIVDSSVGVPFCEKYIVMRDGQRLPKHYHVSKNEDIINRAGGPLRVLLWNVDPATGKLAEGVAAQAEQALKNLEAVLKAAGASMADVVKTTVFVKDLADFGTVNTIYGQHFGADFPARSCVQVAALPAGGLVEIEAVAFKSADESYSF